MINNSSSNIQKIENYVSKVVNIGFEHEKSSVYTVGVAIYEEVNKWYKNTIWIIDKELNRPSYKYKKKYGLLYDIQLKIMHKKLNKTRLYKEFIYPMKLDDENIGRIFKENLNINYGG